MAPRDWRLIRSTAALILVHLAILGAGALLIYAAVKP